MTDTTDSSAPAELPPTPGVRGRSRWIVAIVVALSLASVALAIFAVTRDHETRQEEVARRGAEVMPFDLHATRHEFRMTQTGAYQTVTANRSDDRYQIELIREHLQGEAQRFRDGDFSDPAVIHGDDMPGLAVLKRSRGRIAVVYRELPAGASITYITTDATVRVALAAWIKAQTMDHGTGMHHG